MAEEKIEPNVLSLTNDINISAIKLNDRYESVYKILLATIAKRDELQEAAKNTLKIIADKDKIIADLTLKVTGLETTLHAPPVNDSPKAEPRRS